MGGRSGLSHLLGLPVPPPAMLRVPRSTRAKVAGSGDLSPCCRIPAGMKGHRAPLHATGGGSSAAAVALAPASRLLPRRWKRRGGSCSLRVVLSPRAGCCGSLWAPMGEPPSLPVLPALLCLQICTLLFASLYILCHFIITHFKKHADFTAGRRAGAAEAVLSLPRACSSMTPLGAPGAMGQEQSPDPPREGLCSTGMGRSKASPSPSGLGCSPLQSTMMRMLLSTGSRKFLPVQ